MICLPKNNSNIAIKNSWNNNNKTNSSKLRAIINISRTIDSLPMKQKEY